MATTSVVRDVTTAPRGIDALLLPRSLAIVGDSPNQGFAANIHRNIVTAGYEGAIHPVNPRYEEVNGLTCYPTVDAIPGGVDLAIVVVPSRLVMNVLDQCERAKVGAINIITSGFGEQADDEAHERQALIRAFAARTGIRIVGPNCLGNISVPVKLGAMSGPFGQLKRGPVALALQSGLLAYSLVLPAFDRDMGFTYVVTTGNEADLDAVDLISYFIDDEETRVIGAFVEQFRDAEKLLAVAERAADAGKPIAVLKIGRSEAGRRSALAHTGSLVGSDDVADAVMRQHGLIRVNNLDEMTETLAAFYTDRLPQGPGVGAIYVSGGAAGLISDLSADLGISLPDLAPETVARLEEVIPEFGTVGNPLDTTGMGGAIPELMEGALVGMAEDPSIHTVIYGQAYPVSVDLDTPTGQVMEGVTSRYPDKVFVAVALVTGKIAPAVKRGSRELATNTTVLWGGVPFLQGAENGLKAVRALNTYATFLRGRGRREAPAATAPAVIAQARAIIADAAGLPLVERRAKELLALYGLPVTREQLADCAEQAVAAARAIGYPVVLKIESPQITHKTDAGGVLLGLDDDDAVRTGFERIKSSAAAYDPKARLDGVLVQAMAERGRELILGMTQDPQFGPVVAVGVGGIFVEVFKDVALGVPPLDQADVEGMLNRLRGKAILEGARGANPADVASVIDIVTRFARLCTDLADVVAEIDINPIIVYDAGRGATIVDCLVVPKTT